MNFLNMVSIVDNVVTMMEDLEVELTLIDMISRHIKVNTSNNPDFSEL